VCGYEDSLGGISHGLFPIVRKVAYLASYVHHQLSWPFIPAPSRDGTSTTGISPFCFSLSRDCTSDLHRHFVPATSRDWTL
jgi:hypothetical protein